MVAVVGSVLGLALTGCVETVDGRHRAGMPFQKDRIEGRYERPATEIYTAAKDVIKRQGAITSEDSVRNSIQGVVDEHNVWVAVEAVDGKTSRVIVQARKSGLANADLAAYLEKEIAVRLATGRVDTTSTPPK